MLPLWTRPALAILVMGVVCLVLSLVLGSMVFAASGLLLIATLALVFAHTVPLGRHTRRQGIEFFWQVQRVRPWQSEPAHFRTIEVRLRFTNPSASDLDLAGLRIMVPPGLEEIDESQRSFRLPPSHRGIVVRTLRAYAPGRYVLPGLAAERLGAFGLFRVALYFPNPLEIVVTPHEERALAARLPRAGSVQSGREAVVRMAEGDEWRELREMHGSDSLRKIAWRASARRGKWLVRETHDTTRASVTLELDAGARSRSGAHGLRDLDQGVHQVAQQARQLLHVGLDVGFVAIDREKQGAHAKSPRILAQIKAGAGPLQHAKIVAALLEVMHPVDADLTAYGQNEVIDAVGHYLRRQENIDCVVHASSGQMEWNVREMVDNVRRLSRQDEGRFSARFVVDKPLTRANAENPSLTVLRRFCKTRGIDLGYR